MQASDKRRKHILCLKTQPSYTMAARSLDYFVLVMSGLKLSYYSWPSDLDRVPVLIDLHGLAPTRHRSLLGSLTTLTPHMIGRQDPGPVLSTQATLAAVPRFDLGQPSIWTRRRASPPSGRFAGCWGGSGASSISPNLSLTMSLATAVMMPSTPRSHAFV